LERRKGVSMTIEQYFALCQSFDWFYEYSDDFRVWEAGENGRKSLEKYASNDPIFMDIFLAWKNYNFSGSNFGTPQCPKPDMSDFI